MYQDGVFYTILCVCFQTKVHPCKYLQYRYQLQVLRMKPR